VIKFLINLLYRNNPKCMCGYKMKPSNFRGFDEYSWKCIFVKKCGVKAYETSNGTMHWFKKK